MTARLAWLERNHDGYSPGAYDRLAAAYRQAGHVEASRRVAVGKQQRRRAELSLPGKAWNWLLYLTVGYGYRTWLAATWLAGLLVLGSIVFGRSYPAHIHPAATTVPRFNPVIYTLDTILPVINLGQKDAWIAQGSAQICWWLLTIAGWVLTIAIVAGLTSALSKHGSPARSNESELAKR